MLACSIVRSHLSISAAMDDGHSTISSCQLAVMSDVVNAPLLSVLSRVYLPVISRVISDIKIEWHSVAHSGFYENALYKFTFTYLLTYLLTVERIYLRQSRWCRKIVTVKQTPGDTVILPRRVEHSGTDAPLNHSPHSVNNKTVAQLPLTSSQVHIRLSAAVLL